MNMDDKFSNVLKQTPQMLVKLMRLQDLSPQQWIFDKKKGVIRKPDGSFFSIGGIAIESRGVLEVRKWEQPVVIEKGGEVTLATFNEQFLVRPKQEPGNPAEFNFALWVAGFQASDANKTQAHGGEKPLYTDVEKLGKVVIKINQPKDANRFYGKINTLRILKLDDEPQLLGGARLLSEKDLAQIIISGLANEHLLEAYALLKAREALNIF